MVLALVLVVALVLAAVLAFAGVAVLAHGDHKCVHDEVSAQMESHAAPQRYVHVYKDASGRRTERRQVVGPLRIFVDTDKLSSTAETDSGYTCYPSDQTASRSVTTSYGNVLCTAEETLTAGKERYLRAVLTAAQTRLGDALRVDQISGNLVLPGTLTNCYPNRAITPSPVPSQYHSPGQPNADIVLFASARPIQSSSTLAFASDCAQDQIGRPIAGFMNYNPAKLVDLATGSDPEDEWDFEKDVGTAMHEMSHALGFSGGKLDNFFDRVANATRPTSEVYRDDTINGASVRRLITANVLATAREHFGCTDASALPGVEVENGGGGGTAGSHWEKRLLNTEYMIGTSSRTPRLTNFSLSFFADTGWYFPDFSQAEPLRWGRSQGCDFVGRCTEWPEDDGYLCTSETATSCSFDRFGKAGCNVENYGSALPTEYQYFAAPNRGGGDELMDYCPTFKTYSNGWCTDTRNEPIPVPPQGDRYGASSRCFDSKLTEGIATGTTEYAQLCYETYCAGPERLKLRLGSDPVWYPCSIGTTLEINGWGGDLKCPDNDVICEGSTVDVLWPEVTGIDPAEGGPGTSITITGSAFRAGEMSVKVDAVTCEGVEVQDENTLTCTLPGAISWTNPKYLAPSSLDVVVSDDAGRTGVGLDAFEFTLELPTDEFVAFIDWIGDNPGIGAALIISVVLMCGMWCWFCYHERKRALNGPRDSDGGYNWE